MLRFVSVFLPVLVLENSYISTAQKLLVLKAADLPSNKAGHFVLLTEGFPQPSAVSW